ncbi:MAG: hypothetical protein RIA63_12815, partial [Cyclobacteriaceae bacterium]
KEMVSIVRYQPIPKLNLVAKMIYAEAGRDTTSSNWGSDLLKSNSTRQREFGNFIGQGVSTKIAYLDFTASYMLKHNLFIDLNVVRRDQNAPAISQRNNTTISSVALRWNIGRRLYDF